MDEKVEKLCISLKSITGINHMDNYNYETRLWRSGYTRAMKDIDKILDGFIREKSYV